MDVDRNELFDRCKAVEDSARELPRWQYRLVNEYLAAVWEFWDSGNDAAAEMFLVAAERAAAGKAVACATL